jgi:hypothetical protein
VAQGFKKEAQGVQVSPLNPYMFLPGPAPAAASTVSAALL